ncbi:helix-turn-helix domain-containing protein [Urbifossiella limnaea]|uniref:Helix-turn-helix domain protein n=1 Tax=Urbifossiella limnaea TaxID=2528023 RepID=A0A517XN52_9BACT|nr:Helix-turn-helix domain protein [Urbifossiella limnaea]
MLSVKDCAKRAGVCESVVRGWIKTGQLAHYRLGLRRGKIVVDLADLDALLATFRVERKGLEPRQTPAPPKSVYRHLRLS